MTARHLMRSAGMALALLMLAACNENALLDNLSQQQANQVLTVLQRHDIQANKNGSQKQGYSISVASADATAALSVLTQYQLPAKEDVQIAQAFPESSLVSSPMAEQVRVLSLEEQRMEQSLRIIPQVVNAKVHIGYPEISEQNGDTTPQQRVGVLITYDGDLNENLFISQVKELIKNSLHAVRYDNISVVMFEAPTLQHAPPTPARSMQTSPLFLWWGGILALVTLGAGYLVTRGVLRKYGRDKLQNNGMTDPQVTE